MVTSHMLQCGGKKLIATVDSYNSKQSGNEQHKTKTNKTAKPISPKLSAE